MDNCVHAELDDRLVRLSTGRGTLTIDIEAASLLRDELAGALAAFARRHPPVIPPDVGGYAIGTRR